MHHSRANVHDTLVLVCTECPHARHPSSISRYKKTLSQQRTLTSLRLRPKYRPTPSCNRFAPTFLVLSHRGAQKNTRARGNKLAQVETNDASFQLMRLDSLPAGLPHCVRGFCDARTISMAGPSPSRGTSWATPDLLSRDTDRWALHLLQRGRPERRSDASAAARTSLFIAHVRVSLHSAF